VRGPQLTGRALWQCQGRQNAAQKAEKQQGSSEIGMEQGSTEGRMQQDSAAAQEGSSSLGAADREGGHQSVFHLGSQLLRSLTVY